MSNIDNNETVDATFPVAGQDNNSQGFRDNFSLIKTNFATAKVEITALETNSAKLNSNNNFSGNEVSGALFKGNFTKSHDAGTVSTNQNISLANGNFQTIIVGANVTLTLADWSSHSNALESVVIQVVKAGGDRTVTWAANGGTIKTATGFPTPFTVDSTTNPLVVEFYTYDNGATVFARYIGQFS
jgi:hypothetical protein|tara:strand:+ start:4231 stop:4788 length:558 start_codon:yes stop_codon:yes gene_type:complete